MIWLVATALAGTPFEAGLLRRSPRTPSAMLTEQGVLGSSLMSFTRLEVGAPVWWSGSRQAGFALSADGALYAGYVPKEDRSGFMLRNAGGGLWFLLGNAQVQHSIGLLARAAPLPGGAYGVARDEASGLSIGAAYRLRVERRVFDFDLAVDGGFSSLSLIRLDVNPNLTFKLANLPVGFQVGGLLGLQNLAFLSMGVRVQPTPGLELGATALLGAEVFTETLNAKSAHIHLSPMITARFQIPEKSTP